MEGFEPIVRGLDAKWGATEEPTVGSEIVVHLESKSISCDIAGIRQDADTTVLMVFDWVRFEESKIREAVDSHPDISMEEATREIEFGEDVVMLSGVLPWERVVWIEVNTDDLFA